MGKIDDATIQAVLERAAIVDVVGDFVELKKKGLRYIGLCPFHDDRHATNFSVYPQKQCYRCFACGAKGDVVKFWKEHEKMTFPDAIRWLGKKYCIPVDDVPMNWTPPPPRPKPKPKPMLVLPIEVVKNRKSVEKDNLIEWIKGISWDGAQRARVDSVLAEYYVQHAVQIADDEKRPNITTRHHFTIFWQIDEKMQVRTGKMMKYKVDGHRDKDAFFSFDWIHTCFARPRIKRDEKGMAVMGDDGKPVMECRYKHVYDPDKQDVVHTLFGMHLLDKYPNAEVRIVESEKTAIIMAIAYGNHYMQVWMACGGIENLTKERLAPIIKQGRRIVLYPDRDGVKAWEKKAHELGYIKMTVDARPVTEWWKPQDGEKADIADVVVRSIIEHSKT